jgi:hypothetical protein
MPSKAATDEAFTAFIAPVTIGSCILANQMVGAPARAREHIVFTAGNFRQLLFAKVACVLFTFQLVKVNLLAEIQMACLFFSQNFETHT